MLNKTILLLCFFTITHGFSQRVSQELKAVLSALDYSKFEAYAEQVQDSYVKDEYFAQESYLINRDIFDQYHETYVQIQESYLIDSIDAKHGLNLFNLKIISHCDTILFYEISRQESQKDENGYWIQAEMIEVATQTDLKRYKKFTLNYEEIFHTHFDKTDLFIEDIGIKYGFACGLGGGLMSLRKQVNGFVEAKDTVAILDWLSCARPVFQLYAIDGILTLKEQGVYFEPYVYNIIQIIKAKEGTVLACQGCVVMPESISGIAAAILARHEFTF
ncbi:MAG: hypothetical protein GQ574_19475 [Crocinitomix sp.]|nr:hypothetical protein [Crocinitomix sp.]